MERNGIEKSYFDVLGICCPSEVPLIEKILKGMDGIHKVTVIVPSKTVIVEHDPLLISQLQIVKELNQARLEATIRSYGNDKIINKWPSPYILACGVFLLISLFSRFFHPLQWLAIAAVAVGLPPIVLRSIVAIRRCTLDINILMLIAVGGAVALRDFSEAGFIVFLFTIAEWLETRASHKATAGMSALMNMAPQKAIMAETGQVVDARDVMVSSILAVKAGEVIPIDGIVVEGKSEVNEQSLTGESFPVAKQPQSLVWAGTLNIDGYISVRTTALAENSAVAKMTRLVEEAQNSRSKTQRLIDSCTKYYTPVVAVIASSVAVIPLILRVHNRNHWFQLALVLLVSACPCALVLSTPVATFCSLLSAARVGLLVKGGDVLEALASTKVVAFDKTGTITKGEFTVIEIHPINGQVNMNSFLYWISSIESKSSHPMASALVNHARSKSIEPKPDNVTEFQIYPGEGVSGEIDGKKIYIGSKRIATRAGCDSVPNSGKEGMKEAVTRGYVFSDAELIGMFTLSDSCRTGAAEAIRELKALNVKTAMLTGDSTTAAMHAQNQLGNAIEIVHAELLPEDKVRFINDLKTKEGPTTMVGDGMNDAPALAAANVGISMGISGSAVAMETSHITLMSNDILKIPKAIRLARRTHCKIMINILFSVITKIGILTLAIAGHPLLWAAVLADVGTCLVVILNSMTLLKTKATKGRKSCCRSSHTSNAHRHVYTNHCSSSHASDGHKHAHTNHCNSTHDTDGHRHVRTDPCNSVHTSDTHVDMHTDHCNTVKHDHCCQEREVSGHECGEAHCSDREESESDCGLSPGHGHCCQELGRRTTGMSHNDIVPADCREEHHCEGAHNGFEAENHEDHVHFQCSTEHCGNGEHVQELKNVDCCSGFGAMKHDGGTDVRRREKHQQIVFVEDEEEHHHERNENHTNKRKCNSHTSHIEKREIGGCCTTVRKENGRRDCCESSLQGALLQRRVTGRCCKSYVRECRKREGCCAGGMTHLPEIVIE